jgi:hypothetical protein
LYTWRFLKELEQTTDSKLVQLFLKWFARISIVLIPTALTSIVLAWIVEGSKYEYYIAHLSKSEATHYRRIALPLEKTMNSLGPLTNLISCFILTMVVYKVVKLSKQVQVGKDAVAAKNKINTLVTASHVGVTLACTFSQTSIIFAKNPTQNYRMQSAYLFFGGVGDIFLSVMLWFILDNQKQATVLA